MSSEQSPSEVPPMDVMARLAAIRKIGLYQTHIAKAVGISQGFVHAVLHEEKHGTRARAVMEYVADRLELPVETVFPNYERRRPFGPDRRAAA